MCRTSYRGVVDFQPTVSLIFSRSIMFSIILDVLQATGTKVINISNLMFIFE